MCALPIYSLLGRDLMRQAFKLSGGPLCDTEVVRGEQEAMADLFAGAIGIFKNPTSHRDEVIATANEAAEALMTASHLMRVLDRVEARHEREQSGGATCRAGECEFVCIPVCAGYLK